MKSEVEEYCKSEFHHYLESATQVMQLVWEEDEAPDYYLYVHGKKYAVEVTTLVEKTEVGDLSLSSIGIVASLWGLVDEVEEAVKEDSVLNGAYNVYFSRPIDGFGTIRSRLFEDLFNYVRQTQGQSCASEKVVFEQGDQRCTIEKLHDQKSYIGKTGPAGAKWEGEIAEEVCTLLQERIDTKRTFDT